MVYMAARNVPGSNLHFLLEQKFQGCLSLNYEGPFHGYATAFIITIKRPPILLVALG